MTKPYLDQIGLLRVIGKYLDKRGLSPNTRQLNVILDATNRIKDAMDIKHQPAIPGMGLKAWLKCDETGRSSKVMARRLGCYCEPDPFVSGELNREHPVDPSDFGRCVGLLEAVPKMRPYLHYMAYVSPTWAALVARWDELEALYREELPSGYAPKLNAIMQAIIEQTEAK